MSTYEQKCPNSITTNRTAIYPGTGEVKSETTFTKPCGTKSCQHCTDRLITQQTAHYTRMLENLPSLKFITLTIRDKRGENPIQARTRLNKIWKGFNDKMPKECKKRGQVFVWLLGTGVSQRGYPHLHIVASIPLEAEEIRNRWRKHGGGKVNVQEVPDTQFLATKIRYTLKNGFDDGKKAKSIGHSPRSIRCSKGLAFYGGNAKAERKKFAIARRKKKDVLDDQPCMSEADFADHLIEMLSREPGQLVLTPDGYGSFIGRTFQGGARVLLKEEEAERTYDILDVTPMTVELPDVEILTQRMTGRLLE